MDYEHIEDIAKDLNVDRDRLQEAIDQLRIKTVQLAVPPSEVGISTAVNHQDAERLRSYFGAPMRFSADAGKLSCRCNASETLEPPCLVEVMDHDITDYTLGLIRELAVKLRADGHDLPGHTLDEAAEFLIEQLRDAGWKPPDAA